MRYRFSIIATIIMLLISKTCGDDGDCSESYNLDVVNDLVNHFEVKWIILQTCRKFDHYVFNLSSTMRQSMNIYTSVYDWSDFSYVAKWEDGFRPLVLLSCSVKCIHGVNELMKFDLMTEFTWLAFTDDPETDVAGIKIPIDSLFLTAKKIMSDTYELCEMYQVASDTELIRRHIGNWTSRRGLSFTDVPLQERRSNFHGYNMTTLVEANDSLNRLISIYNYYFPCYVAIAKRMNFRVKNITDMNRSYEVSVIMDWTDVERNVMYLQPLYSSWQAIFFKDIGRRIQLDGYLKPFKATVWFAMLFISVLAGFSSYIISALLSRRSDGNKTQRLDQYVYQSLYILLQKGEALDVFTSQKVVTLSQWLISIFLLSCYSATFISFISVVIPKPPFTTIDGILEQGTHNIVTAKHISAGTFNLKETNDLKLKMLYEKHFDPVRNVKEHAVQEFCNHDNYLFITSEQYIKIVKVSREYQHCHISSTQIRLSLRHLSWSLPKGSRYQKFFIFYINKMNYAGVLQSCFVKRQSYGQVSDPNGFRGIVLDDVIILFIILAIGTIVSILLFLLEVIYKKLKFSFIKK